MPGATHIIGAGLAGLSAATCLASRGRRVMLYEAGDQAGGRCRSYNDAAFGGMIDNGNHLLLSGNKAAMSYLERVGSADTFMTENSIFHFLDAQTGKRCALNPNKGCSFFWTLARNHRLWHTLLLSALNTHPQEASAQLAASVLRKTLLKGGSACVPLVANGLSETFINPALRYLAQHNAAIAFNRRLLHIERDGERAIMLRFTDGSAVALAEDDDTICALPAWNAKAVLPGIRAPDRWRAIVNAHFCIEPPPGLPPMLGVTGATVEWIFAFPKRISVTISNANKLMQEDRETLAQILWQEVAKITGLTGKIPAWQVIKEKRATFAATPEQNAKRPGTATPWRNLYLAGDWVQTGLPATMEGAILSGQRAAEMIAAKA